MPTITQFDLSAIPTALLAPAVPPGHETVWGFLARTEPASLGLMLDPVGGLAEDDRRARRVAYGMGAPVVMVPAPEALRAAGLAEVGAFPAAVLERAFPVNP